MEIQSRPELAFDEQQHLYTLGGFGPAECDADYVSDEQHALCGRSAGGVGCGGGQRNAGAMNRSATMSGMVCLKRMKTLRHTSERFSAFAKIIRQLGRAARFAPIIDR